MPETTCVVPFCSWKWHYRFPMDKTQRRRQKF